MLCPINCQKCTNDSVCEQCIVGSYWKKGTCQQCTIDNCVDCLSDLLCKVCANGYYSSPTKGYCLPCHSSSCEICSTAVNCLVCKPGTYMTTTAGRTSSCNACAATCQNCVGSTKKDCTFCNADYYLDSGECLPCSKAIPGCVTCAQETSSLVPTCTTCMNDLVQINGSCVPCSQDCVACNSTGCISCAVTYFLNS